jgi:hypothetical protein
LKRSVLKKNTKPLINSPTERRKKLKLSSIFLLKQQFTPQGTICNQIKDFKLLKKLRWERLKVK